MSETTKKQPWSKVRDFNLARTNVWILFGWQFLETIIPFLVVWLLLSPDFQNFNFNYYLTMGDARIGGFVGISLSLIVWAVLLNFTTFFLRWQKADSFTFTFCFSIVAFMILINGLWQYDWNAKLELKIFLRFLITIFSLIPTMFFGLVITSLMRNWAYRVEDDEQAMLIAYQNGQPVPSKAKLKLARALKHQKKREAELLELNEFKKELEGKLTNAYDERRDKYLAKEAKMDAKEAKKRIKDQKKQSKK